MTRITKDQLWKGSIEDLIFDFMKFFFPNLAPMIDWSRGVRFLDGELPRLMRGFAKGGRTADKLCQFYHKDGSENWLMAHVEVQSQPDKNISERMYTMHYRIKDK